MTIVGGSVHMPQGGTAGLGVTVTGPGPGNGWTRVLVFDDVLPQSGGGNESWAFFAFCDYGNITGGGFPYSCEVAFGDDQGPDLSTVCSSGTDAFLLRPADGHPLASVPVQWLRTYDSSGSHGQWNTARRPAIWARVNPRRGSAPPASFIVSGASIYAFRISGVLGSQDYFEDDFIGVTNLTPSAWGAPFGNFIPQEVLRTSFTGVFDGSDDWLIFWSVRYQPGTERNPRATPQPPLFYVTADPALAGVERIRTPGGVSANPAFNRYGIQQRGSPYGLPVPPPVSEICCHSIGGFFIENDPIDGIDYRVYGLNGLTSAGVNGYDLCRVREINIFGIRTTNLGFFRGTNKLQNSQERDDPKPINIDLARSPAIANQEVVELDVPFITSVEALACWVTSPPASSKVAAIPSSHNGNFRQRGLFRHSVHPGTQAREGAPIVAGETVDGLGVFSNPQTRYHGVDLAQPTGTNARTPCAFCGVAFLWDNDPDYQPDLLPAAPARTFLDPDRESLAVGSLTQLAIEPSSVMVTTPSRTRHQMVADDGTIHTWPRFLRVRRVFQFQFEARDKTDRDTLATLHKGYAFSYLWKKTNSDPGTLIALIALGDAVESVSAEGYPSGTFEMTAVEAVWTQ